MVSGERPVFVVIAKFVIIDIYPTPHAEIDGLSITHLYPSMGNGYTPSKKNVKALTPKDGELERLISDIANHFVEIIGTNGIAHGVHVTEPDEVPKGSAKTVHVDTGNGEVLNHPNVGGNNATNPP